MPFSQDPSGADRNVPSVAAGAGLGTSPPAPVIAANSDDARGLVTFGSGSVPAAGTIFTVTWSRPHDANRLPTVMLTEATTATAGVDLAVTSITATGFVVAQNTRLVTASQPAGTYGLYYQVID